MLRGGSLPVGIQPGRRVRLLQEALRLRAAQMVRAQAVRLQRSGSLAMETCRGRRSRLRWRMPTMRSERPR